MAIQMRQGAYADFDPSKMRAGEWAVSTDSDTLKQQIWMCFAPGVVKRIGTIEDFDVEIKILFQSYMDDISNSVNTARGYADTATTQADNASNSATKAKTSETNAKTSETNAKTSETKASTSANNASASATKASTSEANAKTSETNASTYASNAKASENSATASKIASATSEANAKKYADQAKASATNASTSATNASASASNAKTSETNAKTSEGNSALSEQEAQKYAEQAKSISESLSGTLRPLGTINFADLPSTADATSGDMYNILDQFTTTTDFKEGSGNIIPAGSNVYLTIDRMWDVLAGTPVTGVKGNAESLYRRGNVNITPANIGALATNGDASNATAKFTTATSRANIATGEKMSVIFGKIAKWFADIKGHAFKDTVSNLTTIDTGSALDASQGKVLDDKISYTNVAYATCSTEAATADKAVTVVGNPNWQLKQGAIVIAKFTTTNTASNCTINVNNTGAKPIWYNTAKYTGNTNWICGYANKYITYMYDGTYWVWLGHGADYNTTYTGATLKTGADKTGTGTTVTNTIAKNTTVDNAVGTLLNNDVALNTAIGTTDISAIGDGTLKGAVSTLNNNLAIQNLPENHRMIFRGKNLGTKLTSEQLVHIQDGTFEDLWLGDYWVINNVKWLIADFDYWYNCGDSAFTKHHLVIIPETALYNAKMNTSNTTAGGYVGSAMYTSNLANAKTIVNAAFGSAVLTHREYLCNAVSNGKPSGGTWLDSSVELPNECMMYGHLHLSPTSDGTTVPMIYTISKVQLALFMVKPNLIVDRTHNQWLRDVVSSNLFALASYGGSANSGNASNSFGVRPVFPIG